VLDKVIVINLVVAKQCLYFFDKFGLDIDEPMIGLIDHFPKTTAVIRQWQPPNHKEYHPAMF
jgi:hypothetical protein